MSIKPGDIIVNLVGSHGCSQEVLTRRFGGLGAVVLHFGILVRLREVVFFAEVDQSIIVSFGSAADKNPNDNLESRAKPTFTTHQNLFMKHSIRMTRLSFRIMPLPEVMASNCL